MLCEEPATYTDRKVGWYIAADHLTLEENARGELQRVVFNGRRRDSWAQAAAGRVALEALLENSTAEAAGLRCGGRGDDSKNGEPMAASW